MYVNCRFDVSRFKKLVEFEYTYDFTLKSKIYHYTSQMKPGGSASILIWFFRLLGYV